MTRRSRKAKSRTLTDTLARWSRPPRRTKAWDRAIAAMTDYPYNLRADVFCWLWSNHAELAEARRVWHLSWEGVAWMMAEDGVRDRHGREPSPNAVRRVWGRVCREIEAKAAKAGLP